ncbi:hypothetical protein BCD67_19700 [Oscillatoriales cyanobacterium USR001]|nr:hypothetical protein BCD67_19700 [Oscillatoriales cyanobacterium USR001]
MNSIQRYQVALAVSLIIFSLNGSNLLPPEVKQSIPPLPVTPTPTATPKSESLDPPRPPELKPVAIADSVTVTIYEVDSQCQALIPQKVSVRREHPIEAAVSKVLEQQYTSDFDLSYRVILDRSQRLATIDLRIPANSKRQLASLSSCEQLALFGSLRQTLIGNRGWQIQKVRFTEEGQEIWL